MLRDWQVAHPDDCELYQRAKRAAAKEITEHGGLVMQYNRHNQPVLWAIYFNDGPSRRQDRRGRIHDQRVWFAEPRL